MAWTTTATMVALGIGSLVASAAGTGLAVYGQQQQAQGQADIANYNFKVQEQNAAISRRATEIQATYRAQAAQAQMQTQLNNAQALNDQARAVEAQGREQGRRMQEEKEQQLSRMRAKYAKSGVTTEGSPLIALGKSATLLELAIQDGSYQAEMEARAYDRKALMEKADAGSSLFDKHIADYEYAAAAAGQAISLNTARADLASGLSQANSTKTASYGTILSGFADATNGAGSWYDRYQGSKLLKPATTVRPNASR